jgi:hypothetical protein
VIGIRKYFAIRWLGSLCVLTLVLGVSAADTDIKLDKVTADGEMYSNVVVFSKSATHISISHSRGMANIKADSLDTATQRKLGFLAAEEPAAVTKLPTIGGMTTDPRIRELQERYQKNVEEFVQQLDPTMAYKILALLGILYLFFCYCCWQICRKTSNRAGLLVWLPGFQMIPLLRAAGMSPWLFLLVLAPPVTLVAWIIWSFPATIVAAAVSAIANLIIWIVWCFRICRVRQKSPLLGIMMLLPVTNVMAFVYLALSGYGPEADNPYEGGKIKLGFQPSS